MSVPAPQDPLRLLQIATSHSEQLDNSLNRQAEMGPCQWPVYAIDLWDREWELRPGGWWFWWQQHIQYPISLSLGPTPLSTWTCASKLGSTGPSRPTE